MSTPTPIIPGNYQYRANYCGPVFQRFFHHQRKLLIDWLLSVRPGDRVLDAGCGSGVFADYMSRKDALVWGVDILQDAIDFAQATLSRPGLTFWCRPLHEISLPDASVDRILMAEVLEHLTPDYQETVAREFDRLLAPGGLLLVTAPNYRSAWPLVEMVSDALHLVPSLRAQHVTRTSAAYLRRCPFNRVATLKAVGCFSYLAPALAVLNWRLAERMAAFEHRLPLPGGLQVYGLWEKLR